MSDKTYDVLKNVALFIAPLTVFLSTLLGIWNIPYQQEITQTLAAVDTLIGALVIACKKQYEKEDEE